jgi:hypothetical protein
MLTTRSMADYRRTSEAYRLREPGWYTVNRHTDNAVFGPASQEECRAHKLRVNRDWPVCDPDDLEVLLIPDGKD